jgi:hypothetical protein
LNSLPGLDWLSDDPELLSGVPSVLTDCTTPWALVTVVVIVPSGLVTDVVVVALEELLAPPPPPPPPAPLAALAPGVAFALPLAIALLAGAAVEIGEGWVIAPLIALMALMVVLLTSLSPRA